MRTATFVAVALVIAQALTAAAFVAWLVCTLGMVGGVAK